MTGTGTVQPSIAAGRAADAAGNSNSAATHTDNTVTYDDDSAPIVTITSFAVSSGSMVTASGTGGTSPGDNPGITIVICKVSADTCPEAELVATLTTTRDATTGAWTATSGSLGAHPDLHVRAHQTDLSGNAGTSAAAGPISTP